MPHPRNETAVELAKRLGTYGKSDRSRQYEGRYSNEVLLRNDNLVFQRIREIEEQQFRHNVILALLALVAPVLAFTMWYFG